MKVNIIIEDADIEALKTLALFGVDSISIEQLREVMEDTIQEVQTQEETVLETEDEKEKDVRGRYTCSHCLASFTSQNSMNSHMKHCKKKPKATSRRKRQGRRDQPFNPFEPNALAKRNATSVPEKPKYVPLADSEIKDASISYVAGKSGGVISSVDLADVLLVRSVKNGFDGDKKDLFAQLNAKIGDHIKAIGAALTPSLCIVMDMQPDGVQMSLFGPAPGVDELTSRL
jgi:hypothetical protein